jgi:hypothetical protein
LGGNVVGERKTSLFGDSACLGEGKDGEDLKGKQQQEKDSFGESNFIDT